jgi:hypothetical protein
MKSSNVFSALTLLWAASVRSALAHAPAAPVVLMSGLAAAPGASSAPTTAQHNSTRNDNADISDLQV